MSGDRQVVLVFSTWKRNGNYTHIEKPIMSLGTTFLLQSDFWTTCGVEVGFVNTMFDRVDLEWGVNVNVPVAVNFR
jgi:hypothetical protein